MWMIFICTCASQHRIKQCNELAEIKNTKEKKILYKKCIYVSVKKREKIKNLHTIVVKIFNQAQVNLFIQWFFFELLLLTLTAVKKKIRHEI